MTRSKYIFVSKQARRLSGIILTIGCIITILLLIRVLLVEYNMYTCGECRLYRFTRHIAGIPITDSTVKTECHLWYLSQYGNNHNHIWVRAPITQFRDIYGEGKSSITYINGESLWAFSSEKQLNYLRSTKEPIRTIRFRKIRRLYNLTLQGDEKSARKVLDKIKDEYYSSHVAE